MNGRYVFDSPKTESSSLCFSLKFPLSWKKVVYLINLECLRADNAPRYYAWFLKKEHVFILRVIPASARVVDISSTWLMCYSAVVA